jgi:WD40 repeat protein
MSPDGRYLVVFGKSPTFEIRDAMSGELRHKVSYPFSLRYSGWDVAQGRLYTWGNSGGENWFHIWDMETGEQISKRKTSSVRERINPDGTLIWLVEYNLISILAPETGEVLTRLDHESRVTDAAWSQDRSRLLSWTEKEVMVWNARSGDQLLNLDVWLPQHRYVKVIKAAWDEEERNILVYADRKKDHAIYARNILFKWPASLEPLFEMAQALKIRDFTREERKRFFLE